MTINQLIKKLQRLEKTVGKRMQVTVDVENVKRRADDMSHWQIDDIHWTTITWYKDDSCVLADGTERIKSVVVLS